MALTRNIVRVFLASPGDLAAERRRAKEISDEFNRNWARHLNYQIELIGWEDTVSQVGRPQQIINADMATCELFIGLMWKHWGTPPDMKGKFTSGFHEEFTISLERFLSTSEPSMKMLFKSIPSELVRDAGPSLNRVLEFKQEMIDRKEVYFE